MVEIVEAEPERGGDRCELGSTPDRCADTIEQPVHHLERRRHASGAFGGLGPDPLDQSVAFDAYVGAWLRSEFVDERQQLLAGIDRRRGARGDRRQVDRLSDCISARTEEVGVGQ